MGENIVYKDESFRIMGACFDVYKHMGNGFLEAVYQECLGYEFKDRNIAYVEHPKLNLKFKERTLKQSYVPDFLCYDKIIIEIKSVRKLADEHRAQVINYLKATDIKLGILINFGHYPKVEDERFVNL